MLCLKVGLVRTPCTTQYPPCTPYNLCLKTASQIPRTTGQSVGEPADKKTPTPPHPFKECLDFLPFFLLESFPSSPRKTITIFQSAVFFLLLKCLIQLGTRTQYSGRHGKKFGDVFKIALNRTRPGLHESTAIRF